MAFRRAARPLLAAAAARRAPLATASAAHTRRAPVARRWAPASLPRRFASAAAADSASEAEEEEAVASEGDDDVDTVAYAEAAEWSAPYIAPVDTSANVAAGKAAAAAAAGPHAHHAPLLNPGMELDGGWINSVRVNKNAVERRAAEIGPRRSVKKDHQAAWLLRAVTCIDLTTLSGDDTTGKVQRMCAKARNPVRRDVLEMLLGADWEARVGKIHCGAVCVYPARVPDAVRALEGTGIPVASVATGFPSGQIKTEHKLAEIRQCVADGAREIDIVISRDLALKQDWRAMYEEVLAFRDACGPAHMKTILATGELPTLKMVYQASLVCMMAGADFIKTSTGKEPFNATIPVSLVMVRAAREYLERTGYPVGFKPAGGISSAKQALQYQAMMKDELGDEWTKPHMFRFGASTLLTDIERQLYHQATQEYARDEYFAMG
uniref:deoxyribose-phosphate aldolase n=1 Tax=Bicosoecida sp. CB-2014 TaxID=1486930 RepID=A0A7S1C953_9STRA|mmetsp:Transcript_18067/g.63937  ORF Transcript_18067/g.63937 Transcript_18067/m.63937 type:complete len:437 (+) Transcript_18067:346-1656(+)